MPDPMSAKLAAYLDGELDRAAEIELEAHLANCAECRAELEELRRLSSLLQAAPQPAFTPTATFKNQLMLQLPRRAETHKAHSSLRLLPWLAPALVLAAWVFIQITLGFTSLLSLANRAGILDGAAAWVSTGPQQTTWFSAAQALMGGLFGSQAPAGLSALNDYALFAQNLLIMLAWQMGLALLYCAALALVLHSRVRALWNSITSGEPS
jgi:anti-sigma factor RsiW